MKLRLLGSGTSSGVPRIGGDWGACDPAEPRNRRLRASALVQTATTTILIDTSPDMREQLLAAEVGHIDAVIWTHDHADHCHGIDDLRQLWFARGSAIPAYGRPSLLRTLQGRFGYVFQGSHGYPPTATALALADDQMVGDIRVRVADQPHGGITSAGLRFEADGVSIGYATDFHDMTHEMRALYGELGTWVVDALREAPHPSHPTLSQVLKWVGELKPRRTVLMHMDHSMDYRVVAARLPPSVEPGYDGLEIVG